MFTANIAELEIIKTKNLLLKLSTFVENTDISQTIYKQAMKQNQTINLQLEPA